MDMKKWLKRISVGIVSLVVAWLLIGFTYEHVSRVVANRKYSPEGGFVDANGHQLHYLKQGSGSPTVIFESGLSPLGHLFWYMTKRKMSSRNQFSFSTESIVVGNEAFVTETKKALGARALGRSAVGKDTDFQLRESHEPYNALFASEKDVLRAENRHPWDGNHTITIVWLGPTRIQLSAIILFFRLLADGLPLPETIRCCQQSPQWRYCVAKDCGQS